MKLSACWIVKNEAANIPRSIESVKDVVDEMIVVDTGSTDDTVKIAESFGARVEHFEWINDFSAARNYGISFATGDVFLIMDGDFYFDPPLSPDNCARIEAEFANNPQREMISVQITNLEMPSGKIKDISITTNIFRNIPAMRYQGKVHEFIAKTNPNGSVMMEGVNLCHTGYSSDLISGKFKRNNEMINVLLENASLSTEEKVRYLTYNTRESYFLGNRDEAIDYLEEILRHPDALRRVAAFYNVGFSYNLYIALEVALMKRARVSRRDIDRKLIKLFKATYSAYSGAAEIDLVYQLYFDLKEDRLLRELPSALEAAARIHSSATTFYKEYERKLYWAAAAAAKRRNDPVRTMEYAAAAFRTGVMDYNNFSLLALLLSSLKGQPPEDIALLLGSLFDLSDPEAMTYLLRGTMMDGLRELRAYYLKKRLDRQEALFDDLFSLLLIYGKHEELIGNAAVTFDAGQPAAAQYIFLAAVCGAPEERIRAQAGKLEEYEHILRAFYAGERLAEIKEWDARLLGDTYIAVAFSAGIEAGDRYLDVFRNDPALCYTIKAAYCDFSGLPEPILREDMAGIDKTNLVCRRYRIQALILTGRYADALCEIEDFLKEEIVEAELLHLLLVVAEQAEGATGEKARRLYDGYIELYDLTVDLGDVVNTGIVFADDAAKLKKTFRSLSRIQFDSLLREEAARPATKALLELCRKAADIYRENRLPAEAARCLCRVAAHGAAAPADVETLIGLFTALQNAALPEYIKNTYKAGASK